MARVKAEHVEWCINNTCYTSTNGISSKRSDLSKDEVQLLQSGVQDTIRVRLSEEVPMVFQM
jgi:hypothetical protein